MIEDLLGILLLIYMMPLFILLIPLPERRQKSDKDES